MCLGINYTKVQQYSVSQREKASFIGNEIPGDLWKYRDIDLVLKEKLQNVDADFFICERHFASDDIEYTSNFF